MEWEKLFKEMETIDIHYAATEDQQKRMYELTKDIKGTFVELGVAHGRTSYMLAQICKDNKGEFYCVDDFSLEGTEKQFRKTLKDKKVPFTLLVGKTQEVEWDKPIDVLFIDAGHDEANVKPDCERWLPFVKKGGLVFFHDWPLDGIGCHWAVKHYGELNTKGWEHIDWVAGMEVRKKC